MTRGDGGKPIRLLAIFLSATFAFVATGRLFVLGFRSGPAIACYSPVFDFGEIAKGSEVVHEFMIKNVGTSSLDIKDIDSGCGCTVATAERFVIEPGDSMSLKVRLSSIDLGSGQHRKRVSIYSNDSRNSRLILTLKGRVAERLSIVPSKIHFGELAKSGDQQHCEDVRISIHSSLKRPLRLLGTEASSRYIEAAALEDRGGIFLRVTLELDPSWDEYIRENITILTDDSIQPTITIPILAHILHN